ncbi:MAG: hypothetical protein K2L01_00955, partial [Rikenellaceae bacterium]|nr:hypothetical protein [Rikenellaceae bacterium]
MKNKQDFILKVEGEGAISSLNRFVHRRFDRSVAVWSDCAGHNILLFVMDGEAMFSGDFDSSSACGATLNRKVILLPAGNPFVVEFQPGCEVLAYSFDSYLPMDASLWTGIARGAEHVADEPVTADIPIALHRELVNVCKNIGAIISNETLTHLA